MRYVITINQKQCLQFNLDKNQGALMDLLSQLSSWAKPVHIDGEVYYNLAYNKVVSELPMFFKTTDSVYRSLNKLKSIAFIEQKKVGKNLMNFVRLTDQGKAFLSFGKNPEASQGSEKIPTRFGKNPEAKKVPQTPINKEEVVQGSEKIPTYNIITTNNNIYRDFEALSFIEKYDKEALDIFCMQHKKQIKDWDKFLQYFEIKVQEENIEFQTNKLLGRLKRLSFNWSKESTAVNSVNAVALGAMPQMKKIS